MSEWEEFGRRLKALAQQILDDIVEDKFGIEANAEQNNSDGYLPNVEDFSDSAFGAADSIVEALEKFETGQCTREALMNEAEESCDMLDDCDAVRWSNSDAKQRYIEFRRALEDLPEMLQHGQPLRRNYYVYVHKDHDGNVFYVGKGAGQRAWSEERDSVWRRYVKEKLGGRFEVEIIKNDLHEDEAFALEERTMLKYGDRLLNFYKPGEVVTIEGQVEQFGDFTIQSKMTLMGGHTSEADREMQKRYSKLRDGNKAFVADTKPLETTNLELAVTRYREALLKMREYEEIGRRLSRSPGLRGEYEEYFQQSTGDVAILDRLTLCLGKLNRTAEAVAEAEQHFAEFPADRETSVGQAIVKRIERMKAKAKKIINTYSTDF